MGVLYDYFRAADDAAAVRLMEDLEGGPVALANGGSPVDAVDCKGIDPVVALGKLVGFVRGLDWSVDLVGSGLLWSGSEDEGPWLISIDDGTRDSLASVPVAQMPELSARWGQIEEWAGSEPLPEDQLVPVIEEITGLARRARDAGAHLYCWCCL